MICVIDESSPHNWAASDFYEHWLLIISNIWNNYGIHKQRAGMGVEVGCHHHKEFKGEWGSLRQSGEFTRWNVNSTDRSVSKALCCPEEVWSRAAGPPPTGQSMRKWDLCSGESILLLVLRSFSVSKSHLRLPLYVFFPDVLTYCLTCCWVFRWCTSNVQTKNSSFFKAYLT